MRAPRTTAPGKVGAAHMPPAKCAGGQAASVGSATAPILDEPEPQAAAEPASDGTRASAPRARILVVDDDPAVCRMLQLALKIAGYAVTSLSRPREALARLESQPVDLVITDLVMPDVEGIEIIMRASQAHRPVPVIAISGAGADGPDEYLAIARLLGADRTLSKPFDCRQLLNMVDELLARGA